MDKRKAAEIILQTIDDLAPATVNWNQRDWWLNAIVDGLKRVEKVKAPGIAISSEMSEKGILRFNFDNLIAALEESKTSLSNNDIQYLYCITMEVINHQGEKGQL